MERHVNAGPYVYCVPRRQFLWRSTWFRLVSAGRSLLYISIQILDAYRGAEYSNPSVANPLPSPASRLSKSSTYRRVLVRYQPIPPSPLIWIMIRNRPELQSPIRPSSYSMRTTPVYVLASWNCRQIPTWALSSPIFFNRLL